MFNKEGIPFFIIIIPFLSIVFIAFFSLSYYLKLTDQNFEKDLQSFKTVYLQQANVSFQSFEKIEKQKREELHLRKDEYIHYMMILTGCILSFMALFTWLMTTIINDIVKKYVKQVQTEEQKLHDLNSTLATKVRFGIEEGKRKDKAILRQSRLARIGSMISMIAHQWRQPLSELSGVLLELETATRFKKVTPEHILNSIDRGDKMIEFMSNTIDDFRNFYKPDKTKEIFWVQDSCQKAINLIDATVKNLNITLNFSIQEDKQILGYPTEYSQVILNILSNAKDILVEKQIQNARIDLIIDVQDDVSIVTIKDNAGGINEEHFDLLFDPYFSTKDSSVGTGLGLYISRLIIEENMSGELNVKNDEEGAVFEIMLKGKS